MTEPTPPGSAPGAAPRSTPGADRLTTRVWYLVAAGLILSALTMAGIGYGQMVRSVEGMQRVPMPGRADIILPESGSTLYLEHRSVMKGTPHTSPADLVVTCRFDDPKNRVAKFDRVTKEVTYSSGDFAGRSAFDIVIKEAGTYALVCDGPSPFVIAVGRGLGAWVVIAAVGLLPFVGGVIIIAFVFFRRRHQKRHATR